MTKPNLDTYSTFFELLKVSLGNAECLSHTPTDSEWRELFQLSEKQCLLGICFEGIERLTIQQQLPPTKLLLKWLGQTDHIKAVNEIVNVQCLELQRQLFSNGFQNSILKGQGIAQYYPNHLKMLRQSGDIDVWVKGGMANALTYAKKTYGKVEYDYINAHIPVFNDTEVELHWRVSQMQNLKKNRMLQRWMSNNEALIVSGKVEMPTGEMLVVPSLEFNLFYILLHIYNHEFSEGIGLRQLMDYYFVLQRIDNNCEIAKVFIAKFGLRKFASGILWIMKQVFGMPQFQVSKICSSLELDMNENEGKFLLHEIMQNGNFGHYDNRIKKISNGKIQFLWSNIQHNWHLATHYPTEFFWAPIWLVYHFFWKRWDHKKNMLDIV